MSKSETKKDKDDFTVVGDALRKLKEAAEKRNGEVTADASKSEKKKE